MSVNATVLEQLSGSERSVVGCCALQFAIIYRFTFKLPGSCFVLKSAPSEKVFALWASGRVKVNCNLSVDIFILDDINEV